MGIKNLILGKKKETQTNDIEALKQKFASVSSQNTESNNPNANLNSNNQNPNMVNNQNINPNNNQNLNNNFQNFNNNSTPIQNQTNNNMAGNSGMQENIMQQQQTGQINQTQNSQQAQPNPNQLNVTEMVGNQSTTESVHLNPPKEEEKKVNDDYLEKVILEQDKGEDSSTEKLQKERDVSKKSIAKYLEQIKENHEETKLINLVIQQIKELIEIDNHLSKKIDEVQKAVSREIAEREKIVKTVDKHYKETKKIEKNMEKFVGLYEAVTNNFNPFVEDKEQGNLTGRDFEKNSANVISKDNLIKKEDNPDETENDSGANGKDSSYAQSLFQQLKKQKDQGSSKSSKDNKSNEDDDDDDEESTDSEGGDGDAKSLFAKLKAEKEKEQASKTNAPQQVEITEMKNPEIKQTKVLPEHLHFKLTSGKSINSLSGLVEFLIESSDEEFSEYVTHYKNDFSGWIYNTFHNETLSKKLSEVKTKQEMIDILKEEINK